MWLLSPWSKRLPDTWSIWKYDLTAGLQCVLRAAHIELERFPATVGMPLVHTSCKYLQP